jgi:hypothetical protein
MVCAKSAAAQGMTVTKIAVQSRPMFRESHIPSQNMQRQNEPKKRLKAKERVCLWVDPVGECFM